MKTQQELFTQDVLLALSGTIINKLPTVQQVLREWLEQQRSDNKADEEIIAPMWWV